MYLQIIFCGLFAIGLYNILSSVFKVPVVERSSIVFKLINDNEKRASAIENVIYTVAKAISKLIRYDAVNKSAIEFKLKVFNFNLSAEMYISLIIAKTLFILLLTIPCFLIFPFLSLVIVFLAIYYFFSAKNDLNKKLKKRSEIIDREIPRFAKTFIEKFKQL